MDRRWGRVSRSIVSLLLHVRIVGLVGRRTSLHVSLATTRLQRDPRVAVVRGSTSPGFGQAGLRQERVRILPQSPHTAAPLAPRPQRSMKKPTRPRLPSLVAVASAGTTTKCPRPD